MAETPAIEPETETEETIIADAADVAMVAAAACEVNRQAWLSALVPLSQFRITLTEWDGKVDDRVLHALDMAMVAACERIGRLCRSDVE